MLSAGPFNHWKVPLSLVPLREHSREKGLPAEGEPEEVASTLMETGWISGIKKTSKQKIYIY